MLNKPYEFIFIVIETPSKSVEYFKHVSIKTEKITQVDFKYVLIKLNYKMKILWNVYFCKEEKKVSKFPVVLRAVSESGTILARPTI